MSWPGFYSLSALWLLALIPPLVLFYFLKLKRPRLVIPSLVLWRQVLNDSRVNSPFQKFKRNILLLLQLLLLILLILAAMQPYFRGTADQVKRLPVLIDCSASMAATHPQTGKSRLDLAKAELEKMIDGLLPDQELCLISFSQSARKLTGFTNNRRILRDALGQVHVQDVPGDLEDALRMAGAIARSEPFEKVLLLSDGNLPAEANFDLPFNLDYRLLDPAGANAGITACNARRSGPGRWDLFVSVEGSADADNTGSVRLLQDGQEVGSEPVTVRGARTERLVFRIAAQTRTSLELRLTLDRPDSLPSDNVAFLELAPARKLRVFVAANLRPHRLALQSVEGLDLYPKPGQSDGPGDYDLLISDRDADLALRSEVAWIEGQTPRELTSLIRMTSQGTEVVDWRRTAPLLEHVELADLILLDSPQAQPQAAESDYENLGFQVLAYGQSGPLILSKEQGRRIDYYALFRVERSTLPYRLGFPILLANLTRQALQRAGLAETRGARTGVLPPLTLSALEEYGVRGPHNAGPRLERTITSDEQGELRGVPAPQVGYYEISRGSNKVAQVGASLLSSEETTLARVQKLRFHELSVAASARQVQVDRSFWPVLATMALLVLLVEWWFYQKKPAGLKPRR